MKIILNQRLLVLTEIFATNQKICGPQTLGIYMQPIFTPGKAKAEGIKKPGCLAVLKRT